MREASPPWQAVYMVTHGVKDGMSISGDEIIPVFSDIFNPYTERKQRI